MAVLRLNTIIASCRGRYGQRPCPVPYPRRFCHQSQLAAHYAYEQMYSLLKSREGLDNVVALDLAANGDIEGLTRVLTVADVRAKDRDALHNGEEDVGGKRRFRGETDDHEVASGAEVVHSLLVRLRGGGGDNSGVRALAVASSLDIRNEVLGLAEIYPALRAKLEAQVALLGTGVCGK